MLFAGEMLKSEVENVPFWFQRHFPLDYRTEITKETRLFQYAVQQPSALPAALASPSWDALVHRCKDWHLLSFESAQLVIRILFLLGFYGHAIDLLQRDARVHHAAPGWSSLMVAAAKVKIYRSGFLSDGEMSDVVESLNKCVIEKGASLRTRLSAHQHLFLIYLTDFKDLQSATRHITAVEQMLIELDGEMSTFERSVRVSSWYRAAAMIPFAKRDHSDTRAYMASSESIATGLQPTNEFERLIKQDLLYSIYESSMKAALGSGEIAKARELATQQTKRFPFDVAAYFELGEVCVEDGDTRAAASAFHRAAMFGPPGTAHAYFMSAQCYRDQNLPTHALRCLDACLRVDELAISASDELEELADEAFPFLRECGKNMSGLIPDRSTTTNLEGAI
ncbi:Tetratricopeptide repeat-containing protein [Paraburkholderia fungorum]|uniref:Tetratricopeptide repeat-containing protein n=1 Tax=Paraburkholderia fungorum TaxID=134537 RepID=A0A1H1JX01_9BURK|nr:tetratricopeptide repeat protein [Paraburkholderia fungorum]SDR54466.1 Tetratricopeptide repeat-containing protein [Paraburkholderia fungorum]